VNRLPTLLLFPHSHQDRHLELAVEVRGVEVAVDRRRYAIVATRAADRLFVEAPDILVPARRRAGGRPRYDNRARQGRGTRSLPRKSIPGPAAETTTSSDETAVAAVIGSPCFHLLPRAAYPGLERLPRLAVSRRCLVRHGTADIARSLVLSHTLVSDLTQQVVVSPCQVFDLEHELGPNPVDAAEDER
jgi:hypothetical protein